MNGVPKTLGMGPTFDTWSRVELGGLCVSECWTPPGKSQPFFPPQPVNHFPQSPCLFTERERESIELPFFSVQIGNNKICNCTTHLVFLTPPPYTLYCPFLHAFSPSSPLTLHLFSPLTPPHSPPPPHPRASSMHGSYTVVLSGPELRMLIFISFI